MASTHHGVHLFNLILMHRDAKTGKPVRAVGMWIAVSLSLQGHNSREQRDHRSFVNSSYPFPASAAQGACHLACNRSTNC
jgi:hypothetical protein